MVVLYLMMSSKGDVPTYFKMCIRDRSLGARILCDHFTLFTELSDTLDGRPIVVEPAPDNKLSLIHI